MEPSSADASDVDADAGPRGRRLASLSLAALGVVFGDIGTSPLYALRECFGEEYGVAASPTNVLGVLSLMTWSLVVVVSVKYLSLILRADNDGEGGIIALLAQARTTHRARGRALLIALGLFGASLLYGDGMITPAISVLSAVEGLSVATPALTPLVLPITAVILVALFLFQSRGTARIGAVFGPVMLLWFAVLAALGVRGIAQGPEVLAAVSPLHAATFFATNRAQGFFVLGAVFLVVTGAEALYADLGHFGRRPIRTAWFALVFPALLLNYYGQGGIVLHSADAVSHPFFALTPQWATYPMVALATVATIIASQAVISGAFSLTHQAIQLGYCPRLRIQHTSTETIGQIYIPQINWLLMVASVVLVIGFGSSSRLAAAYGVAVTTTMIIATTLFYFVARERWGWSRLKAGAPTIVFLCVDLAFFTANIGKIAHGAWFPLAIGACVYVVLSTWQRGRTRLGHRFRAEALPLPELCKRVRRERPLRVPGRAVYMSANVGITPPALLKNLEHNKVLHEEVVVLSVVTRGSPRVSREDRFEMETLGDGLHRIVAYFGFMEDPHVPHVLLQAKGAGLSGSARDTTFFLGRERLLTGPRSGMPRWRSKLFGFLSHNAVGATSFFHIPPERVVEIGAQVSL